MFTVRPLRVESKVTSNPLALFVAKSEKPIKFLKQVCFYRLTGMDGTDQEFIDMILQIDDTIKKEQPETPYLRLSPSGLSARIDHLHIYTAAYDEWKAHLKDSPEIQYACKLPVSFADSTMEWTFKRAYQNTLEIFQRESAHISDSMVRNFGVKLLFWANQYLPRLFNPAAPATIAYPKVVYSGSAKKQESLFLYFLALMGCDVLYFNPEGDFSGPCQSVAAFSKLHIVGAPRPCALPVPPMEVSTPPARPVREEIPSPPRAASMPATRPSAPPAPSAPRIETPVQPPVPPAPSRSAAPPGHERSYEELAQLSSSVVMIKVFDESGSCTKSGSGVVVGDGYILTNCHVISGSRHFSLRFENEAEEYHTEALVKYHPDYDLALLRIDKHCQPIPVLREGNLVRGQRVVAIGSPLGLFNSVSDGIISGFRKINDISMVQVTAPISHGSSGGALLDMYGRLIGIVTSGFDNGQNLNLAVDFSTIRSFAGNFLR